MARCITLGNYNRNYKYIILYIIFRLIYEYFLGDVFPDEMKINFLKEKNIPEQIIVYDIFKFFVMLILGLIIAKIELKKNSTPQIEPERTISTESEEQLEDGVIAKEEEKEEKKKKEKWISPFIFHFSLVAIYIIATKLPEYFFLIGLKGLDFWNVKIFFVCLLNFLMYKTKIYNHQKLAIAIVLFFPTIMKILSIISIYKYAGDKRKHDTIEPKEIIYKEFNFFIPIGIIGFLIIFFVHAFILCKLKSYFYLKFLSPSRILIYFGIAGTLFSLIGSFISNYVECKGEFSKYICFIDGPNSKKYFDSFQNFFGKIWNLNGRSPFEKFGYIIIFIIQLFMDAIHYFLIFLLIDLFNPEFYLCFDSLFYFIAKFICLIYYLVVNIKYAFLFETLAQAFAIIGAIIYLELIELNFCNLNFNLKKNIKERAANDIFELLKIDNNDNNRNSNELEE